MARKTVVDTDTTDTTVDTEMTDTITPPDCEFSFDEFAGSGEDLALEIKYPSCNFLNAPVHPYKHGLFIPLQSLTQAGWTGPEPNYTHSYRGKNSETTPGILFNEETDAPRMLILRRSPRYIEISRKGAKDNASDILAMIPNFLPINIVDLEIKESMILANYDTQVGKDFYAAMQDFKRGLLSLRTFYLVFFVDKANNLLHNIPFKFSLKGASAASFGPALEQMQLQGVMAFAKKYQKPLSATYLPLLVFEPKIVGAMVGDEDQSLVCKIDSFTSINTDNFLQYFAGTVADTKEHVQVFVTASENFTAKALGEYQEQGFHQLAPGVEAVDVKALPSVTYETGED